MKSFAFREFRATFDEGGLVAVTPRAEPDSPALLGLEFGSLHRDGIPVIGRLEPAVMDVDEVEQRWLASDVASIEVRHSFEGGWRTRMVLTDRSGALWTAQLRFTLTAAAGWQTWRSATGSDAVLALLPETSETRILYVGSSAIGPPVTVSAADHAVDIGPCRIQAGQRLVVSWEWSVARHPRQLAAAVSSRSPARPRWSTVALGEEIWLPADPDAALVVDGELATIDLGDRQALVAYEPGRRRVELRSARGTSTFDLAWVPTVSDFLVQVAERALEEPAGPAGVVGLPDLATALVVQRVARVAGFPGAAAASDALDQFTARFVEGPDATLAAIFLAGEYDRLGDPDLIARATDLLAPLGSRVPGLGLALVRTAVASVVAGRVPEPGPRMPPLFAEGAADLEWLFATRPPDLAAEHPAAPTGLYRLGLDLRAGLPGRLPERSDADVATVASLAHAVAVLRLVPDQLGAWWRTHFGIGVEEVADGRALDLVEQLGDAPIGPAHAWLVLGT